MQSKPNQKYSFALCAVATVALAFGAPALWKQEAGPNSCRDNPVATVSNRAQVAQQTVPPIWANHPPGFRSYLMAIDEFIENPPGNMDLAGIVTAFLGTPQPQLEKFKLFLALAIVDRRRASLLPPLLLSLTASSTPDESIRIQLAALFRKYILLHGTSDFSPTMKGALLHLYGNPGSSPTLLQRVLSKVLADLNVAH